MLKSLRGLFFCFILLMLFSTSVSQPSFASPASQAQSDDNVRIVTDSETGLYTFIGIDSAVTGAALPGATALQNGTPTAATALADISIYARSFGLSNPSQELQFLKASAYQSGSRSFRYQQVYQGIPVIAGEVIANYNRRGSLAALVGEASPNLTVPTTPRLTVDVATVTALSYVARAEGLTVSDLTATPPALWIYDPHLITPENFDPTLVWRLEVSAAAGLAPFRYLILVDALNGGVVLGFNQIDSAWHGSAADHNIQPQAANPVVANLPLPKVAAPQFAPNYPDPPGAVYDSNHTILLQLGTPLCTTRPANLLGSGQCDTIAATAHYFAYDTFDYYDSQHNRDSIDGAGMSLISNVRYCRDFPNLGIDCAITPNTYYNAFWDGVQMVYGDGGFLVADDVVAHELSHGVTQYASGLLYLYESGAINESLSDIFGELIDQNNGINSTSSGVDGAGSIWFIGEDLTFGAIRNMANPLEFGDPDRTQSPAYDRDLAFEDNGGVHFNSGVSNKAAYLMAAGGTFNGYSIAAMDSDPQLSNDKVSAIFYEVNTNLLPSGADFSILAAAIVQACNNIVAGLNPLGMTPTNCSEAHEATLATQMQLDPVAGVVFRPKADLCPTNQVLVSHLFNDDLEGGAGNYTSDILLGGNDLPDALAWQDSANAPAGYGPYDDDGAHSLFGASYPNMYGPQYAGGEFDLYSAANVMDDALFLPVGSTYYLYFNHSFALEFIPTINFDGAVLEYQLDGGDWVDAGGLYEAGQNYNGTISAQFGNPLGGRKGFVQTSHGFVSTRYNLKSIAGHNVRFRWRIGADFFFSYGWYVDDIQIYNCVSQTAAPTRQYTTDTTPRLTWLGTSWATKYELQIADNSTFTGLSVQLYTINAPATIFDIPTALPLGTHYWRVRAYDGLTPKPYGLTRVDHDWLVNDRQS